MGPEKKILRFYLRSFTILVQCFNPVSTKSFHYLRWIRGANVIQNQVGDAPNHTSKKILPFMRISFFCVVAFRKVWERSLGSSQGVSGGGGPLWYDMHPILNVSLLFSCWFPVLLPFDVFCVIFVLSVMFF